MDLAARKKHWEKIYETKQLNEVSWYQPTPSTSLQFISESGLPLDAKIIDIGGGDSFLVDHLLELGYTNITVLDISHAAIERAQKRLGGKAGKVKWIETDITIFHPEEKYDLWHDRAAFHFLTDENEISAYLDTVKSYLNSGGMFVLGTFSENGPEKCSGIKIRQYSEEGMTKRLETMFNKVNCIRTEHKTPFDTVQHFTFCSFRQK